MLNNTKITNRLRTLFVGILFIFSVSNVYSQHLSIKTNGLMLGAGLPNLGVELVTSKKTSLELSAFAGYHPYKIDFVTIGLIPEFKYWFSGRAMARSYVGVSLLANSYNLKWKERRYEGDALGLGVTFGYSIPLSPHWNLDFSAGLGGVYFRQKDYDAAEVNTSYFANNKGIKFMPTKLAISIAYIIK